MLFHWSLLVVPPRSPPNEANGVDPEDEILSRASLALLGEPRRTSCCMFRTSRSSSGLPDAPFEPDDSSIPPGKAALIIAFAPAMSSGSCVRSSLRGTEIGSIMSFCFVSPVQRDGLIPVRHSPFPPVATTGPSLWPHSLWPNKTRPSLLR